MNKETVSQIIEAFCRDADMKPSSVGQLSVQDRFACERIKTGVASLAVTQRVLDWIEAQRVVRKLERK